MMTRLKLWVLVTTALTAATVIGFASVRGADAARAVRSGGSCGEYMYWKDGKCVDARNREAEPWPDQMAKKKATW